MTVAAAAVEEEERGRRVFWFVSITARATPAVQASAVVMRSRAGNKGDCCCKGWKTGAVDGTIVDVVEEEVEGSVVMIGVGVEEEEVELLLKGSADDGGGDGGVGAGGGGGDGGLMHVHRRVDVN